MGLIMKQLIFVVLMLIAVNVKAANVAFNTSTLNVTPTNLNNLRATNITAPGNLYGGMTSNTFVLFGDVQDGIDYWGLPFPNFKFGIFSKGDGGAHNDHNDIDVAFVSFSGESGHEAKQEFFIVARTNSTSEAQSYHELKARRKGAASSLIYDARGHTNGSCRVIFSGSSTDQTSSERSFFQLRTFDSSFAIGNGGAEAMLTLKTTLPNITNAFFIEFKTNDVTVFSVSDLAHVSARALSLTNALKVGKANQATITNILSGSATLNFASQSLGGSEDLPITVAGAEDGDAVSLGYQSTVATGIIGSYSAWASNGVVFVRFIATAATQNPNSGVFKVVVTKFQ